MYQKVLVALDGSEPSTAALHEAFKMVAATRAPVLRLVNVIDMSQSLLSGEGINYAPIFDELGKAGRAIVGAARQEAKNVGVEAETAVIEGGVLRVADAIVSDAEKWHADVIVVGTHGRHGVGRLLLGSVAEAIARESAIPVLLVRQRPGSEQG